MYASIRRAIINNKVAAAEAGGSHRDRHAAQPVSPHLGPRVARRAFRLPPHTPHPHPHKASSPASRLFAAAAVGAPPPDFIPRRLPLMTRYSFCFSCPYLFMVRRRQTSSPDGLCLPPSARYSPLSHMCVCVCARARAYLGGGGGGGGGGLPGLPSQSSV